MRLRTGTFVFNPDNENLTTHDQVPAPACLTEPLIWTSMGTLLLGPALSGPLVLAWSGAPAWVCALLTAAVSLTILLGGIAARWAWTAWAAVLAYRRHGAVLYGRLLRSTGSSGADLDCPVTIEFTFTDPDGVDVCGRAIRQRPDLVGRLPPRNTPVALLYVSPDRYELL